MSPLNLKLSKIQNQIIQSAIAEYKNHNQHFLGNVSPSVFEGILTIDPTDFPGLMAYATRTTETELEVFRLRALAIQTMKARLLRSKRDSTRLAYNQLIEHTQSNFQIGSLKNSKIEGSKRPLKRTLELLGNQ